MKQLIARMCCAWICVAASWAAEPEVLYVNEAQCMGSGSEALALTPLAIRDGLRDALSQTGKYSVVSSDSALSSPELKDLARSVLYNPSSVSYFGSRLGVTLVVLVRVRLIDKEVLLQAGLFDVEMQVLVNEAKVACPNRIDAIRGSAFTDLAHALSGVQQNAADASTPGAKKPRLGNSLKWMAIGAALAAFSYFTINAALKPEPEPSPTSRTNIDLSW